MKARNILIYLAIKHNGDWDKIYKDIAEKKPLTDEEVENVVSNYQGECITIIDSEYPDKLKAIFKPPFVLFYKGNTSLLQEKTLSIVGTRQATKEGKNAVKKLMPENVVISTGLSLGINEEVIKQALKLNNKVIVTLATGIDKCYPNSLKELQEKVGETGLLISEYPNGVEPSTSHFPLRNRIITGISDLLIVPELLQSGGTNLCVSYALQKGIDVLVAPTSIDSASFNNELIRQGAEPVFDKEQVLENLNQRSEGAEAVA